MIELTFSFFLLAIGLFIEFLSLYNTHCREIDNLWAHEIVYYNDPIKNSEELESFQEETKLTEDEKELFSKIETLTKESYALSNLLLYSFTFLSISFIVLFIESIGFIGFFESLKIKDFYTIEDIKPMILPLYSLILPSILYMYLLPNIFKYTGIKIFSPHKSSKINEKLFDVWCKHRCYEHKYRKFKHKLEPRILYEILAEKYKCGEKRFDGKKIEIPDDIIRELIRCRLLPSDFFKK